LSKTAIVFELGSAELKDETLKLWAESSGWTPKKPNFTPDSETVRGTVAANTRAAEINSDNTLQWLGATQIEGTEDYVLNFNRINEVDNPVTYEESGINAIGEYLRQGHAERLVRSVAPLIEEAQNQARIIVDKEAAKFNGIKIS